MSVLRMAWVLQYLACNRLAT